MFNDDLKIGEEGEKIVMKKLEKYFGHRVFKMNGHFKWFDLVGIGANGTVMTIEVKTDRKFQETGNVAVEVRYKGMETLRESKAESIIYLLGKECWVINRERLLKEIDNYITVSGGDNKDSELVLIPLYNFTQMFHKL